MSDAVLRLKKGEGRTIKNGGAWIFDNELATITGSFKNGDIISVEDFDGYPMGKGFINQNSKIRVRMLTRKSDSSIDYEFLKMRVQNAWNYRKSVLGEGNSVEKLKELPFTGIGKCDNADLNCCRVVFGEADFLPGLTVDKYGDILVIESLALGIDRMKEDIVRALIEVFKEDDIDVRFIFERSDAVVRKKEGMEVFKGLIYQKEGEEFSPFINILENDIKYKVDIVNGQKTGFFLDQKYNRLAMQRICRAVAKSHRTDNIRVLDCFTHMGTFALNCGHALKEGGAENFKVEGLDISEFAVSQATENAYNNDLSDRVFFRAANVLDELPLMNERGEKFDILVLDPPAFTKSREATRNAIKGYRKINMDALRLVKDGGYFASCSCSHFMTQELFTEVINQAAKAVHKRLRQVEFRTQAPDHPILWAADESYYLKFFIFQVVEEK